MNDGQLVAFVAIADAGSITQAARELFISQQALTKRLQSLETELGYQLFTRSHEGVRLTDAGRAFYEDARQLLSIRERALARGAGREAGRPLRVSCRSDAPTMILARVCERCAALHPEVEQDIVPLTSDEQLDAIAAHTVDVTEWPDGDPVHERGLAFHPVVDSPHVCVLPRRHPLASRDHLGLGDLEGHAVTMLDRRRCRNADRLRDLIERDHPRISLSPSRFDASQRLVSAMDDLAVVTPRAFAEGNLGPDQVMLPLDVDVSVAIGLVHRADDTSEELAKFIDAAERAFGRDGA